MLGCTRPCLSVGRPCLYAVLSRPCALSRPARPLTHPSFSPPYALGRGCTPPPRGGTSSATCEGAHAAAGGAGGQAGDAARRGEPNGVKRPAPSPPLDCPPLSVCLPARGARGGGACPKGRGGGGGGGRARVLAGGAAADELAAVSMEARRQVTAVARRGDAARACELCERLFPGVLKEGVRESVRTTSAVVAPLRRPAREAASRALPAPVPGLQSRAISGNLGQPHLGRSRAISADLG